MLIDGCLCSPSVRLPPIDQLGNYGSFRETTQNIKGDKAARAAENKFQNMLQQTFVIISL